MNNYSSKLGEKVFLTKEELVELKLSQQPWVIDATDRDSLDYDDFILSSMYGIICILYTTTNLLQNENNYTVQYDDDSITPIIPVEIVYLRVKRFRTTFTLHPGESYGARKIEDFLTPDVDGKSYL